MNGSETPRQSLVTEAEGEVLLRVQRVYYEYQGNVDRTCGPLELTFSSYLILLFDASPAGEALSIKKQAWRDPFIVPLSKENQAYVRDYGKWTIFDVSNDKWIRDVIGLRVTHSRALLGNGKRTGFTLTLGPRRLHIHVDFDELYVYVLPADPM